jgi:hypothetical protein
MTDVPGLARLAQFYLTCPRAMTAHTAKEETTVPAGEFTQPVR